MKNHVVFYVFLMLSLNGVAGDTLTIFDLYKGVEQNYPELLNKSLYGNMYDRNLDVISRNWYPTLKLQAQATYQSDVFELNLDLPATFNIDFPQMPQDQYKIYLDVQQTIFDGGINNTLKELEKYKLESNQKKSEITFTQVKLKINGLYFGLLLIQENIKLFKVIKTELQGRLKMINGAVKNGVLLPSDRDAVLAELINLEQNLIEIKEERNKITYIVNQLTGMDIDTSEFFQFPVNYNFVDAEYNRPELDLFEIKKLQLDATIQLKKNQNKPMLYAFAQMGYGKPGLNMLSDDFDTYYLAGIGMKWNVFDFGKTSKEIGSLLINKSVIDNSSQGFVKSLNIETNQQLAEQHKLEKIILKDQELVDLRKKITRASLSKLENGIITSVDYLTEYNKEIQAILNKQKHAIQLEKAKITYLTIKGIL